MLNQTAFTFAEPEPLPEHCRHEVKAKPVELPPAPPPPPPNIRTIVGWMLLTRFRDLCWPNAEQLAVDLQDRPWSAELLHVSETLVSLCPTAMGARSTLAAIDRQLDKKRRDWGEAINRKHREYGEYFRMVQVGDVILVINPGHVKSWKVSDPQSVKTLWESQT